MYNNKILFNKNWFGVTNYSSNHTKIKITKIDSSYVKSSKLFLYLPDRSKKVIENYKKVEKDFKYNKTFENEIRFESAKIKKHGILAIENQTKSLYSTVKTKGKLININVKGDLSSSESILVKAELNSNLYYSEFFSLTERSESSLKNTKKFRIVDIDSSKKKFVNDLKGNLNILNEEELKEEIIKNGSEMNVTLDIDFDSLD